MDDGWRRWAPFLEQARTAAEGWSLGQIGADSLTYLFADGFHSASSSHWVMRTGPQLAPAGLSGAARAFSYAGRARPYHTEHTRLNLRTLARRYAEYLVAATGGVVCVDFSLGCLVSLLGVEQVIAAKSRDIAEVVRAIVLIAPALDVNPLVNESYLTWVSQAPAGQVRRRPANVMQILSPRTRGLAVSALAHVFDRAVPVVAIHWPGDLFTPYKCPLPSIDGRLPIEEREVMRDLTLNGLARAITRHIAVRDDHETLAQLIESLVPLV